MIRTVSWQRHAVSKNTLTQTASPLRPKEPSPMPSCDAARTWALPLSFGIRASFETSRRSTPWKSLSRMQRQVGSELSAADEVSGEPQMTDVLFSPTFPCQAQAVEEKGLATIRLPIQGEQVRGNECNVCDSVITSIIIPRVHANRGCPLASMSIPTDRFSSKLTLPACRIAVVYTVS